MTALRVVPSFTLGSRRSMRLVERNLYARWAAPHKA